MRALLVLLVLLVAVALPLSGGWLPATDVSAAGTGPGAPTGVCELTTDKIAQPSKVFLGAEVEVVLTVAARCPDVTQPGKADIVLAIDRSASQRDNGTWEPTIRAATLFLERIDFARHQVSLLTFSGGLWPFTPWAEMHQLLSSDGEAVRAALTAIPPPPVTTGGTNLTAAVAAAQDELTGPRRRADAQPVLVLLSDGGHNVPELISGSPLDAARAAKAAGTLLITIGLGVDEAATATLQEMASRPGLYFPAPTAAELDGILRELAGSVGGTGRLRDLEVVDMLSPEVEYVEGSAVPTPAEARPGLLVWRLPEMPPEGWSARYRVRPLFIGTYATNKLAYVDYLDADGAVGTRDFPQPFVTVTERDGHDVFLPLALKGYCKPGRPFDVVLVLDTSSSMWGEPLDRTREAAADFLRVLQMPPSRAAVVAFHAGPTVVRGLTDDRRAALAALDALPRGEGSRIDLAVLEAVRLLTDRGTADGREAVIVLITDGRQVGAPREAALNAGAAARRAGIRVFTIGFGADTDPDLLLRLAGAPERYFDAPTTADIPRVYRAIAGALPCEPAP